MRHSKKGNLNRWKTVRVFAVVLVVACVSGLIVYKSGAIGGEAAEPVGPEMTEEQRISALADCLTASGARLYGASWCPHCQNQKAAFGAAADRIAYVECVDAEGENGRSAACVEAKISNYPTWIFGGGTRLIGERSFWELARQSGCEW